MRIGLALSGGGFRATLYHLGMVRFLRDSGLLPRVSHITSVSGGSVLASHLVLNWDRYSGSAEDFDAAAQEVLDFIALDVRNRVLRRYPCMAALSVGSRLLLHRPSRALTRTGLLERYYEKHLLGNACLHQLPSSPEVHLLSTNVGEGGLSSFSRRGLFMQMRSGDGVEELKTYRAGLVKVATAVAASSAFPAFFPPMALTADDLGASEGEFPTQYFTDGGVYDNLSVRMFHFLQHEGATSIRLDDLQSPETAVEAWAQAGQESEPTALGRLVEISENLSIGLSSERSGTESKSQRLLDRLNQLMKMPRLHEDEVLVRRLEQHEKVGADNAIDSSPDEAWTRNRRVLNDAFHIATGKNCLHVRQGLCDLILVSDAGRNFAVHGPGRTPGFLATALRSSDILMDRVWNLERQNFADERRCVFSAITDVVTPESDPTAMHPEQQVQVSRMRTDMDRFRRIEISGLIRHGYCVARNVCRSLPSAISEAVAEGPPWDPTARDVEENDKASKFRWRSDRGVSVTKSARDLQNGANRRVWSALLDPQDWLTWIYVPLLVFLLAVLPWYVHRAYRHAHLTADLTRAVVKTRHDFGKTLELLEFDTPPQPVSSGFKEVEKLGPRLADEGLDIISDSRITDLRHWFETPDGPRRVYVCRHVMVRKIEESAGTPSLRLQDLWDSPDLVVHCENELLRPVVRRSNQSPDNDPQGPFAWEVMLDFSGVRLGGTEEVVVEIMQTADEDSPHANREWWHFEIDAQPEVVTSWILLPDGAAGSDFSVVRYRNDNPDVVELIDPTDQTKMEGEEVIIWSVVHPDPGYTYSSRWEG